MCLVTNMVEVCYENTTLEQPDSVVVRTLVSCVRGPGFDPGLSKNFRRSLTPS